MVNYFIPSNTDPTGRQVLINRETSVTGCNVCYTIVGGQEGILIVEGEIDILLAGLGAVRHSTQDSTIVGVKILNILRAEEEITEEIVPPLAVSGTGTPTVATPTPAPTPTYLPWSVTIPAKHSRNLGSATSELFISKTKSILSPVVRRDISITFPNRRSMPVNNIGRKFYIHVWSSPVGTASEQLPNRICNIDIGGRGSRYCYPLSGNGIGIFDTAGDFPLAELIGMNLYILFDMENLVTSHMLELYTYIVTEAVRLYGMSREDRLALELDTQSKSDSLNVVRYMETMKRYNQTSLSDIKDKLSRCEERKVELIRDLTRMNREINNYTRIMLSNDEIQNKDLSKYQEEFNQLLKIPKVLKVMVSGNTIKAFTDTIYALDDRTNKWHEIGKFCIEIYLDGYNNGIRFFNLSRKVGGYRGRMQAPHVYNDGHACLGNQEEVVSSLIAAGEVAALVMVGINILGSANTKDAAGSHVYDWPEVLDPAAVGLPVLKPVEEEDGDG